MIVLENGDKLLGDATAAAEVDYTVHGLDNNSLAQLADGLLGLAGTAGTLYAANSTDVVVSLILVNAGAGQNQVNLYLEPASGTARRIIPKDTKLESGYSLHFDGAKMMVLNTLGQILGQGASGTHGTSGTSGSSGSSGSFGSTWALNPAPAADEWSGITVVLVAEEAVGLGNLCYVGTSGGPAKADVDSAAAMPVKYIATGTCGAGTSGTFLEYGYIHLHSMAPGWGTGIKIYAGSGTGATGHVAGTMSTSAPSGSGDQVQYIGVTMAGDILKFTPSPVIVEIA